MRYLVIIFLFGMLLLCRNNATGQVIHSGQNIALKNKVGLNAFSFNKLLSADSIDIFGLLDYSSDLGFDGVDLTGYYFKGYPEPPSDEYIYSVKKRAFKLGLDICGTGVKNDFCNPDAEVRKQTIELTKKWILVAQKLGAPAIRVFQGSETSPNHSWDEMAGWVSDAIRECADFGKQHGVMIEVQNHNSFLKTAKDVHRIMEMIDHEWVGLMLDIGSYRTADPYKDIEETIQYAISWQLKENVFVNGERREVDLEKIKRIILNSEYKGYLPIETLGEGDPYKKVDKFYRDIIEILK
ncbi:MAG: sugar phosphate isomerase/epimerase [Saprospiraceae bacterium]|jgi:sugar phosphate isomerase/epimerase